MKLVESYKSLAIILLHTLLLFVVLNVVLAGAYFVKDVYVNNRQGKPEMQFKADGQPTDNGKRSHGALDWFDYTALTAVSPEYAGDVLDDFGAMEKQGWIYQPWVQFSEPPFAGKHLSVDLDEKGFPQRRTMSPSSGGSNQVINVFVLGGSTTFGYNVGDEQTWPSYLASVLNDHARADGLHVNINVRNYGHAYYDTSQELALTIDLLKEGHRPNLVLFMDGVNWGPEEDMPILTPQAEQGFAELQQGEKTALGNEQRSFLKKWLPIFRLLSSVRSHWDKSAARGEETSTVIQPVREKHVYEMLERFKQNRSIIKQVCRLYGAEAKFFIQPDAVYNYPVELYRRPVPASFLSSREERKLFYAQLRNDPEILYLGQLFEEFGVKKGRKAIVDDVHYNPEFSRFLAERVASYINLRQTATNPTNGAALVGATRQVRHKETIDYIR
jgi:hypothetical protein